MNAIPQSQAHQSDDSSYVSFLEEVQQQLPTTHVVWDTPSLVRMGRNCGESDILPRGIILPSSADEVSAILKIASIYRIPLYPISTGGNWGYGSAAPASPGCVLLDLRRMNRIIEFDPDLAYAVIEPGVTQQQLYDFLQDQGDTLRADVTGSSPHTSVLGSILERGYGLSLYADRFLHTLNLEVVLPDGSIVHTGFGRVEGATTRNLYRWGIGPALDGLFTQSNYGVVTKATIELMPRPETGGVLNVQFASDSEFAAAMDSLRELRLRGVLRSAVHIASELRVLASSFQHPQQGSERVETLSADSLNQWAGRCGIGAWNIIAGLWGSRRQVKAELASVRAYLKGARITFQSEDQLSFYRRHTRIAKLRYGTGFKRKLELFDLLQGKPSYLPLRAGYWRAPVKPNDDDLDLVRDGCGILWCAPMIPSTSHHLEMFLARTRSIIATHEFEFNVAVTLLAERASVCTVGIFFNAHDSVERQRARLCYKALLQEYMRLGYPPYRHSSNFELAPASLLRGRDGFSSLQSTIKNALDPNGILAPGRYAL